MAKGNRNRPKTMIKQVLGELPFTAELYWQVRQQGKPLSKSFSLQQTKKYLVKWIAAAQAARGTQKSAAGQKIFMFTTLRYWVEHSTLLSLALAGQGHSVTLAYLPLNNWRAPMSRFDLRRQNAYARNMLAPAEDLIHPISLLDMKPGKSGLPDRLVQAIKDVSVRDVQYTLQVEDVDLDSDLYHLRYARNMQAAASAWSWLQAQRPDVVLTPNGSILEMGAIYQAARLLEIPIVTYEFGEQRGRIWLTQDDEVMLQHTAELWSAWKDQPLSEVQTEQIRALYASRQNASLWENFSRRWQGQPSQGGEQVRRALNLDERPVVVLAANVIGDSLTLNRQVYSRNMTEWLQRTLRNFAQRPNAQLVLRIHPGERYTKGPSVADVIQEVMPALPENIHLVAAGDPINTYDLIEIADIGLVYTTTVGMEMAMSGVPTMVSGHTHYRGKGFTLDPDSWEDYFELLNEQLGAGGREPGNRLPRQQVELAWQYAYRFFFDYPMPFPWHMLYFADEQEDWPIDRVLSQEGQAIFGDTFACLAGKPRRYSDSLSRIG